MTGEDVAGSAERARRWVDVAAWTAIGLGLAFTAVNVQTFAAAGAAVGSLGWWAAWLLDPMVSVLLLSVVRAEQVTARWQVAMPWPVAATKWGTFAATYCMNTWSSWRDVVPSGVVLHSVAPLVVLLGAEVAPVLRDRLTAAVHAATGIADPAPTATVTTTSGTAAATDTAAAADEATVSSKPAEQTARAEPDKAEVGAGAGASAVVDSRVREVVELLAAGCEVTGPQVAALRGVSERTGRRLLAEARTHLTHTSTGLGLHLVETTDAGRTA